MTWTANVTIAGELITHASDNSGNINRRDVQVTPGPNTFVAPVSLSQITDIGGVLYVPNDASSTNTSYGCSIAPQHAQSKPARPRPAQTRPAAAPAPPASTTPAGCYPLSNEGTCYEPGEYCRTADHDTSGVAGDGEAIVCEDNNGWRWEPA